MQTHLETFQAQKSNTIHTDTKYSTHLHTHAPIYHKQMYTHSNSAHTFMTNTHVHTPPTIYTTHSSHPINLHKYMNRHHIPHTTYSMHTLKHTVTQTHATNAAHVQIHTSLSHKHTRISHTSHFPSLAHKPLLHINCHKNTIQIMQHCVHFTSHPELQNSLLSRIYIQRRPAAHKLSRNHHTASNPAAVLFLPLALFPVIGKITCNYQMSFGSSSILHFFDDKETIIYSSRYI